MGYAGAMNLGVGTDGWNANMYSTVSAASNTFATVSAVSTAVNHGLTKMRLAWNLRNLSNMLSVFLDGIQEAVESAENGKTKGSPSTREDVESAIRSFEYMYDMLSRLYSTAERKRLTNNSLMAGSLKTIHRRSEELLDIVDWLQTAISYTPSQLEDIFSSARAELSERKAVVLNG